MTSSIFWIYHITQSCCDLLYNLPTLVIDINFSAKGLSLKLKTISIWGKYLLAFESFSCIAKDPSAYINPAK